MKKLILKSAYLKLDKCGLFASIVLSDGKETLKLVTKRQALEIGESLVGLSLLPEEWLAVREQIHSSQLIDKNKHLEEISIQFQGELDELKRMIQKVVEENERRAKEGDDWKFGK